MKNTITCSFCARVFDDAKQVCPRCKQPSRVRALVPNGEQQKPLTRLLSEADTAKVERIRSGPWDVCFGPANEHDSEGTLIQLSKNYGIVKTSVTLIGGDAGAGKSTLSLSVCDEVSHRTGRETLYICAEEEIDEINVRAERLGIRHRNQIRGMSTLTSSEALSNLENIIQEHKPALTIVDSLSGLFDEDHSGAASFLKVMKVFSVRNGFPSLIINHVTKSDDFAGLYKFQHIVDTTMTFTPVDGSEDYRELMTKKNRFGKAFVSVILEMTENGLVYVDPAAENEEVEEEG